MVSYTFSDHETLASKLGGHLTAIHSEADNWLVTYIGGLGRFTALGLTDIATEGTWVWSDGSAVNYTSWYTGQPNNGQGAENCARSRWGGINFWNDVPCTFAGDQGVYTLPASSLCAATNGQGYTCYTADST
eukprot:scaffold60324_cov35-Attheya_sp.AAC.1